MYLWRRPSFRKCLWKKEGTFNFKYTICIHLSQWIIRQIFFVQEQCCQVSRKVRLSCVSGLVLTLHGFCSMKFKCWGLGFGTKTLVWLQWLLCLLWQEGTVEFLCRPVRLSCGQQHTAVVSCSGDVYTWGRSQKGRYVMECDVAYHVTVYLMVITVLMLAFL